MLSLPKAFRGRHDTMGQSTKLQFFVFFCPLLPLALSLLSSAATGALGFGRIGFGLSGPQRARKGRGDVQQVGKWSSGLAQAQLSQPRYSLVRKQAGRKSKCFEV